MSSLPIRQYQPRVALRRECERLDRSKSRRPGWTRNERQAVRSKMPCSCLTSPAALVAERHAECSTCTSIGLSGVRPGNSQSAGRASRQYGRRIVSSCGDCISVRSLAPPAIAGAGFCRDAPGSPCGHCRYSRLSALPLPKRALEQDARRPARSPSCQGQPQMRFDGRCRSRLSGRGSGRRGAELAPKAQGRT